MICTQKKKGKKKIEMKMEKDMGTEREDRQPYEAHIEEGEEEEVG